jgi:hypothetical protein
MAEAFNATSVALTTTSITDAYQAPNTAGTDRAIVLSCLVSNVDGAINSPITVDITDASNVKVGNIATTIVVPADANLELIRNKVVLKAGQKLRATAGSAGDLEVTTSVLEITA